MTSTNNRSQDTKIGPTCSGSSGNGVMIAFDTPPQSKSSVFCITIHAPIITSMVVSISASRSGRRRTNSMAAPTAHPMITARTNAKKKFTPSDTSRKNTA